MAEPPLPLVVLQCSGVDAGLCGEPLRGQAALRPARDQPRPLLACLSYHPRICTVSAPALSARGSTNGYAIFTKAILDARAEERPELVRQFAHSPVLDLPSIQRLFAITLESEVETEVLRKSARQLLSVVVAERANKVKNGISIQYVFDGQTIGSIGQALNEGITQRFTIQAMRKLVDENPDLLKNDESPPPAANSKPYAIEVKLADAVVALVGEDFVGRGYFGGLDNLEELFAAVDAQLGEGALVKLMQAADRADWRSALQILKGNR